MITKRIDHSAMFICLKTNEPIAIIHYPSFLFTNINPDYIDKPVSSKMGLITHDYLNIPTLLKHI